MQQTDKPKWLRKLERESWQAELIISGAAILGSLQLPGLLDDLAADWILNMGRTSLLVWSMVTLYLRIAIYTLIAVFLFHFIVRALWIGMVGLNSVYPQGFTYNELYSEDFQDKIREDYGDISGYILRLDRLASSVFGVGFSLANMMLNIGLIALLIAYAVDYFSDDGPVTDYQLYLLLAVAVSLIVLGVANMALHHKSLRERDWVKRYHYRLSKVQAKMIMPINTSFTTISSNLLMNSFKASKYGIVYVMLGSVAVGAVGGAIASKDAYSRYFSDNYYHRVATDSTAYHHAAYRDSHADGFYFFPRIDGEVHTDSSMLRVWVPLPEREYRVMLSGCSVAEPSDTLSGNAGRAARRERLITCAGEYIDLEINDDRPAVAAITRAWEDSRYGDQYGMSLLVLDPPLRRGKNLLRVTTQYLNEDGEPRVSYVPFLYDGL